MGLLITTEGNYYSGKTSLNKIISPVLESCGFEIKASREPGGDNDGEKIRKYIQSRLIKGASPREIALLVSAARRAHLDNIIIPWLGPDKEQKRIMLLDRYTDSTLVYQGLEGGLQTDEILFLEKLTVGKMTPDLTFILYIPEEKFQTIFPARKSIADEMREKNPNFAIWDKYDIQTQILRQRMYLSLPELYQQMGIRRNFAVIDASLSPVDVATEAFRALNPFLERIEDPKREPESRLQDILVQLNHFRENGGMNEVETNWTRQTSLEFTLCRKKEVR